MLVTIALLHITFVLLVRFMKTLHIIIHGKEPEQESVTDSQFAILPIALVRAVACSFLILHGFSVLVVINFLWNGVGF